MGSAGQQPLMTFASHRQDRLLFRRLLLVGLLGCVFPFPLWAETPPLPSSVWQSAPDQTPAPRMPWVLRDRAIALSPQSLQTLKDAAARPHPPISIELFDDTRYELDITSTISRSNDSAVYAGSSSTPLTGTLLFISPAA